MCTGIAITLSEVPAPLVEVLPGNIHTRGPQQELQFHWRQSPSLLPVWWEGSIQLLRWGNKNRRSPLPYGGWIDRERIETGCLAHMAPVEVVIPANMAHHRGTWFLVEEGLVGVVLPEVPGGPVVYLLTVPATNYYRNMTGQSMTMPVFVNQII